MESLKEVKEWFSEPYEDGDDDYTVIAAAYESGGYDGDAFVLLKKGNQYFETHGGHCSCYGLEGQWDLEETTEEALKHRYKNGYNYGAFASCQEAVKEHFGWTK
jgi:hypothetical protein